MTSATPRPEPRPPAAGRRQGHHARPPARALPRGFTLVELMIAVVVVGLLTAVALPSYQAYVIRSRVPAGLDALQSYQLRMEQRFQDAGTYASGSACALALPAATDTYSFSCSLSGSGTGFTATATGTGRLAGYAYTINDNGVRATTAHPKGLPPGSCWSIGGGKCDM